MPTRSARTRERILSAAAEVLASRGYASTTLEAIAERADMKAGSLYCHFSSKDELVAEVLLEGVGAAHDAVSAAGATGRCLTTSPRRSARRNGPRARRGGTSSLTQ